MMKRYPSVGSYLRGISKMITRATNSDEVLYLEFAKKFITKHTQDNMLFYKDYFVPVYFSAKNNIIYGRAINRNKPNNFSILIEGKSIEEFINNFHENIDMIEKTGLIANE